MQLWQTMDDLRMDHERRAELVRRHVHQESLLAQAGYAHTTPRVQAAAARGLLRLALRLDRSLAARPEAALSGARG